jgi:hypothetical protein
LTPDGGVLLEGRARNGDLRRAQQRTVSRCSMLHIHFISSVVAFDAM